MFSVLFLFTNIQEKMKTLFITKVWIIIPILQKSGQCHQSDKKYITKVKHFGFLTI